MPSIALKVLISPLDWGLGHASRCIPVVRHLISAGHRVTLAGSGRSLLMLQKEFPELESIELQGFSPVYAKNNNTLFRLFLQLPAFFKNAIKEHRKLNRLLSENNFDVVISDNRYGLFNKKCTCILITHQVILKMPFCLKFAEYPLYLFIRTLISRFHQCWIPDTEVSPGLSGDLSHKYPVPANAKFIGPLSHFVSSQKTTVTSAGRKLRITAILSGPEPQRSIFRDLLIRQLNEVDCDATLYEGTPESTREVLQQGNLHIFPHAGSGILAASISESDLIICRAGYTSIMDLAAIGAKALLIPTPGQTEQLYLADLHNKNGQALRRSQYVLDLKQDIPEALCFNGFEPCLESTALADAVKGL